MAVSDVYDALASRRVYKEAMPPEAARKLIVSESGRHFDQAVVEAFLTCFDAIRKFEPSEKECPAPVPALPEDAKSAPAGPALPFMGTVVLGLQALESSF